MCDCALIGFRYPFHLRPKNKQASLYLRMASDLISDLELDQDPGVPTHFTYPGSFSTAPEVGLDGIRAYLAHAYIKEA